jgi:hypothetical protein
MAQINADTVLNRDDRQAAQNVINVVGRVSVSTRQIGKLR